MPIPPSPPPVSRRRLRAVAPALLLLGAGAACRATPGPRAPSCQLVEDGAGPVGAVSIRVEVVARGLEVPWSLAFLPDGSILVTERPGRVRLVRDGEVVAEPVATVVSHGRAEGGLLGIVLHPEYATNGFFYLYYTGGSADEPRNLIERWRLPPGATRATLDRVIFDGIPASRYHDGGRLRFGPDGMLYVGTGDATAPQLSQDLGSPAGKILRLTPDGAIPADNPWPGRPAYVTGVRNVQGFDWREDGVLVVTDHGPSGELGGRRGHDEVSIGAAGANLGWPTVWGCEARDGMVTPAIVFAQAAPPGGAALYTGDAIPEWRGSLLIGVLGGRRLHRVALDEDEPGRVARHEAYLVGDPPTGWGRLRDVIMGPDRQLYITTSNCDGRGTCPGDGDKILRITR